MQVPSREPAEWWGDIEATFFQRFDAFLGQQGFLPSQISGLPDASEFLPGADLDMGNSPPMQT